MDRIDLLILNPLVAVVLVSQRYGLQSPLQHFQEELELLGFFLKRSRMLGTLLERLVLAEPWELFLGPGYHVLKSRWMKSANVQPFSSDRIGQTSSTGVPCSISGPPSPVTLPVAAASSLTLGNCS